jgi:hypothetical protein
VLSTALEPFPAQRFGQTLKTIEGKTGHYNLLQLVRNRVPETGSNTLSPAVSFVILH